MTSHTELDSKQQSREREMEGKAGLRLFVRFLALLNPSAQFARDKLRVGGEIHVGAPPPPLDFC